MMLLDMEFLTTEKNKRIITFLLRLLAVTATAVAAAVMATSHEVVHLSTGTFEAKYTRIPAFTYFVTANVIGSLYGLTVLFIHPEHTFWRFVVGFDVVITLLLTSAASAATETVYLVNEGNSYVRWLPICGHVDSYCSQAEQALVAAFIGVLIYLILLVYTIFIAISELD
ncbi:hypothetical protein NMG60_11013174 [Bertholletia excelsa]